MLLDLLFCKVPTEDFYLVFYWVLVYLVLLICRSLPYILHSSVLLVLCDKNIFFLSVACLFILFTVCCCCCCFVGFFLSFFLPDSPTQLRVGESGPAGSSCCSGCLGRLCLRSEAAVCCHRAA